MNIASNSEMISMAITARGMTAKNLPITPATNISGTNAIMVVATDAKTDGNTSYVPSIAAPTRLSVMVRC